uniref:iron-sulfur cluster repair di-iron protein n=1 Tax=uncultured Draconibacterium sp. TaxID=1573823 RepID=UPI003216E84B
MDTLGNKNHLIGEIVANDFRTAKVFTNAGIDFCCGGKQSVSEVCKKMNISEYELIQELKAVKQDPINHALNFKEWELSFLIDYIINTHHKYVIHALPDLVMYSNKIASVHGENHPELKDIAEKVEAVNVELIQHLKMEEEVLFPAIKQHVLNPVEETKSTIRTEIERMLKEHDFAGSTLDEIQKTTQGYQIPDDACNTYRVTFKLLKEFEDDIHVHVHLENNILFPKILKMC